MRRDINLLYLVLVSVSINAFFFSQLYFSWLRCIFQRFNIVKVQGQADVELRHSQSLNLLSQSGTKSATKCPNLLEYRFRLLLRLKIGLRFLNQFISINEILISYHYIKFQLMDLKTAQTDIKNNKIRQGILYKRSKFLKEWRERWIVLTTNFLYTFTNKKLEELTDVIDLKQVKSYKSYVRKDEEMIPPGFKLRSAEDMFYFCARNCYEKWSWLVSLERLMDYKYVGSSNYNNMEWVKTRGFQSQIEFQNGGAKVAPVQPPTIQIKPEQNKKNVDQEAQRIMKQLQEQQKQLEKKKQELQKKQASINQQKKKEELAKQQEAKKEEKKVQNQSQPPPPPPPAQKQDSPVKQDGGKVSNLRSMFESKINENQQSNMPKYEIEKTDNKKPQPKKEENISISRAKVMNGMFQEFRNDAQEIFGLKYVIDFIVNVTADEKMAYSSNVIIEGKAHRNRHNFAAVFIELLSISDDYQNCENLMRFIETCVFQMPGLFDQTQTAKIQKKLKDYFNAVTNEDKLELILKNMFIMHKLCRYQKNDVFGKLDKLVKEVKNEHTRNWARKLKDDL